MRQDTESYLLWEFLLFRLTESQPFFLVLVAS